MIVYAPSYSGLVQALKICEISDLTVYSSHIEIISFCKNHGINNVELKWNRKGGLANVREARKQIIHSASEISNEEIIFCFNGFDVYGLTFVFCLNSSNKIYFHNKDHFHPKESIFKVLFDKYRNKDFLIFKFILKLPLSSFAITTERKFFGIDEKILKNKFHQLPESYNPEIFNSNRAIILKDIKFEGNAVVFMDQGKKRFNVPDEIIEWIKTKFSNNKIFLKIHPNGLLSNEKLLQFEQLPTSIPVEIILNEECIVVSICSTSLIDDDINCKKYSLVNKVIWKDEANHNRYLQIVAEHKDIVIV
jgi:hypothetical protein